MTLAIQLLLLALIGAASYLLGSYYGVRAQDAERTAREAYNRGWNDGQEVGNRSGRRDGWYAAHKLALSYLKDTPFSAPLKKLVKALAAGEQPTIVRPIGIEMYGNVINNDPATGCMVRAESVKAPFSTTNAPAPVTLTGDGDE